MRYSAKSLFVLSFLCVGCIPSLNEGYTLDTVVYDESLLGTWEDKETTWIFESKQIQLSRNNEAEKHTKSAYLLTHTDGNGKMAKFDAVMFKLGNQSFLDLSINNVDVELNNLAMFQLIGGHLILKFGVVNDIVAFSLPNPIELKKYIKNNPDEITHKRNGEGIYLTGSTEEVQALLQNTDLSAKLFGEPQFLKRIPE
ncbi:MAG: hypothetical protein COA78_25925 [Blastopirellula sp.]|nr:MAG: hypothetical protein COA78_25925 [Blastopirellula sp.]